MKLMKCDMERILRNENNSWVAILNSSCVILWNGDENMVLIKKWREMNDKMFCVFKIFLFGYLL